MKKHRRYFVLLSTAFFLISQISCVSAGSDQKDAKKSTVKNNLVTRAKQTTLKYNLSRITITCLNFQVADEKYEGKPLVDVHEIHDKKCGGDPQTSPRLFSVAFDDRTGEIWSDAKSLVSQMEIIGKE